MALFHTTVVDNQIKALDTIGSVSGSIATFETDKAERLINLEVAITATQSGSGTPSPSNPRPINGFSACNLSVNGTTETIPFGQTIYGGRLNVGSGVLTINFVIYTITNTGWNLYSNYFYLTKSDKYIPSVGDTENYLMCDVLPYDGIRRYASQIEDNTIAQSNNKNFYIKDTSCATIADFYTKYSGSTIVYPLETPIKIQLDSKQIQAIIGTNNIYADTGDIIDLKFVLSVGKAIS